MLNRDVAMDGSDLHNEALDLRALGDQVRV